MANFELWIEAEEWDAGEWQPGDSVTDVIVTLPDGTRWVAAFCAFDHIASLRGGCAESGDCLAGKYLWASDLILIDATSRPSIEAAVADILAKGDLKSAFSEIVEEDEGAEDA
jgi:hypothetical protein